MAPFLRKKSKKKAPSPIPSLPDAPPSLPPLLLDPSLVDPEQLQALPPAASAPALPPVTDPLDALWDPWKAFGPEASNAPRDTHPVATAPKTAPQSHTPKLPSSSSPPAVVRGQMPPPANFDFEESLSAANVTSVVNQFRSYPPPIRHLTSPAASQMAAHNPLSSNPHCQQNPGSSSSLSSNSHHTDATRRTNGSSTSASSLPPAHEVIGPDGRLDPVSSRPAQHNALPASRTRSSSTDSLTPLASLAASRPFTTSNVTPRVHRTPTSVPPTSYAQTPARASSVQSPARMPMLYDMQRSGNPGVPKGPLIFAATAGKTAPSNATRNPYPSPPAEYAPLEASPPPRRSSLTHSRYPTELPPLARKSSKSSLRAALERAPSARGDPGSDSRPRVLTKARPTTPQKPSGHKVVPHPGDPLLLDEDPFARVEGVRVMRPISSSSSSLHMSASEDSHGKTSAPVSPTPVTPDDYKLARQQRRGQWLEKAPPPVVAEVAKQLLEDGEQEPPREPTPPPTYFPIMAFMSDANLLPLLLSYLSYSEWLALYSANNQVRGLFQSRILREFVLERYLSTIGYSKWTYEWAEPLELSLKDLHNYLRGVAMPAHQYARLAAAYLRPNAAKEGAIDTADVDILAQAQTTRAYTRVVLRLRAQADSETKFIKTLQSVESGQAQTSRPGTRQPSVSSRAPSPTSSHSHSRNHSRGKTERGSSSSSSLTTSRFRSPLYRPGRALVLRVFVPSPEGDWLSDASVVECEAELKRSGVLKLLRVGDIVWDIAVGDEGNLGRLIWDGSYLVDLDYRYSRVGELSPYFHSLAFAPSYFHRVIRIGGSSAHNPHCNPIVYMDIRPWGHEIAANLQLLQDRARTETPHGALHDVVRWVHRSTFVIRPPVPPHPGQRARNLRIPIPHTDGFFIDPGWYGKVVLESEGTHEGLADLQARCGPGAFPPRAETLATKMRNEKEKENRRVWRILREKSRPGEIWLRAVQVKERIM